MRNLTVFLALAVSLAGCGGGGGGGGGGGIGAGIRCIFDTIPINFEPVVNAELDTLYVSNEVNTRGLCSGKTMELSGQGEYSIDGGPWATGRRNIDPGDRIRVRVRSADAPGAEKGARITIGSLTSSGTFNPFETNSGSFLVATRFRDDPHSPWVTIEEPVSADTFTTDSPRVWLAGSTFVDAEIPGNCAGITCDPAWIDACEVCPATVRIDWSNAATGASGEALAELDLGPCLVRGSFCDSTTKWRAPVCLSPGNNQLTVRVSGRLGTAEDGLLVSLEDSLGTLPPSVPAGFAADANPEQVTLQWSANPPEEDINSYTIRMAESDWIAWDESLPGAREISTECCEKVVDDLVNDTPYWFGISATNCAGESATSELIPVTPAVLPEAISFEATTDSLTVGLSRRYEAEVLDSLGSPSVGTVVVWTSSDESVATVQGATSETDAEGVAQVTVTALSAGSVEIMGEVWETGVRSSLALLVSEPLRGIAAVAAGTEHSCALMVTGGVLCWGDNEWGQLGDGTLRRSSTPVSVSGLDGVVEVAAGLSHTCALTDAGGVKCWGFNNNGQLGAGDAGGLYSAEPLDVVGLTDGVVALDVGDFHGCAAIEGGGVKCWGYNRYGEVGDGTTTRRSVPVDVLDLIEEQRAVTTGGGHSCSTSRTGVASCWGSNSRGALGNGTDVDSSTPVRVGVPSRSYASITAGGSHTCTIASGDVWCWGSNRSGQLGDGTTTARSLPGETPVLDDVAVISAGGAHSCAVTVTGGISCWGWNNEGQLGVGSRESNPVPTSLSGFWLPALDVAAGPAHTCIVTTEGTVMCAGRNQHGQLGDGTDFNDRLTPVLVVTP